MMDDETVNRFSKFKLKKKEKEVWSWIVVILDPGWLTVREA